MRSHLDQGGVDPRVVRALSHPTRVRILAVLHDRELASPVELANELGIPLGSVGYHVRRLEALGFIELATRTQRRGAVEHHYRARALLDLPATGAGASAADAIAHEAQAALAAGGFDAFAARAASHMLVLDRRGRRQLDALLPRWDATIAKIAQRSAERVAAAGREVALHRATAVVIVLDALEPAEAVQRSIS